MKKIIIQIFAVLFILTLIIFAFNAYINQKVAITSTVKDSCYCYQHGYNNGVKGAKDLHGCYKGNDGHHNIRKAYNEGLWYGQKTAKGINVGYGYQNSLRKYCGY